MNVLIVTGGHLEPGFVKGYIHGKSYDRIIAADAGLAWCRRLRILPTDILGDFDSLKDKEILAFYRDQGIPVKSFPARKDFTDTHLAVLYASELSPAHITILGATGTRYDHVMANISILQGLADRNTECVIVDEHNEIQMLCGPCKRLYRRDARLPFFSLLAWGGDASGIDLSGFSYPLKNADLTTDISLGISNELTEETGTITIRSGYLLIIRSCD